MRMAKKQNILITCECAPNIALIKYWGKLDDELILPLNGSISITLDNKVLCSKTTILLAKHLSQTKKIQFILNKKIQEFDENDLTKQENDLINKKRFFTMLNKVRMNSNLENPFDYQIRIESVNNFPTACGLASSASGFACLAHCLSKAFDYKGDVSELARLGSGSACRSCFGGFVKWKSGKNSQESVSIQLYPSDYWPEMNILILILEDEKKKVPSTNGMKDSVLTSEFLKHRVKLVEEDRLSRMETYIRDKDFKNFAKLIIQDSNSFHSVCMDTYPPLFYLNDKSKEIINFINEFNKPEIKVAYSFDAGPNCFLFLLDKNLNNLLNEINRNFFSNLSENEFRLSAFKPSKPSKNENLIKYLIHSKIGSEPLISSI